MKAFITANITDEVLEELQKKMEIYILTLKRW